MPQAQEPNLAVFIDFDNVALGARDARQRFDIQIVLQRLLEKGKIIVKRAYADWGHHKEYLTDLHQAGIEMIEIPAPQLSGKNSADIRLVVDAMDMCYGKEHMSTFVIVSGDSDFTPLVSKLRENGKAVIGVGMRNSSSRLLIVNCDEFIFYDDLWHERMSRHVEGLSQVPTDKRKLFDFLVSTIQGLMRESRGVLYSSLIKDTMKRKKPEFNEHEHGFSNFGELLEAAMSHGVLEAVRDSRSGGTWVVTALGKGVQQTGGRRESGREAGRTGRRRNGRGRRGEGTAPAADGAAAEAVAATNGAGQAQNALAETITASDLPVRPLPAEAGAEGAAARKSRGRRRGRRRENGARPAEPAVAGAAPPAKAETPSAAPQSSAPPASAAPPAGDKISGAAAAPAAKTRGRRAGTSRRRAGAATPAQPGAAAEKGERPPARKKAPRAKGGAAESSATSAGADKAAPNAQAPAAAKKKAPRRRAPAGGRKPGGESS